MERKLNLTPLNKNRKAVVATEEETDEVSSPVTGNDFRSLLEDYNLKSPTSMQIKVVKKELHNSSPSSSPTPIEQEEQQATPTQHRQPEERTFKNSSSRRVCSFAEERPISDEALMRTPNRFSTSVLPPMASSLVDVDDELDYVEVKRGFTTPIVPNSAQQSEILSLFSTPNIDTPARALQTPSTSTQPTLQDTPLAVEDIAVVPPVLNSINNELKQAALEEEIVISSVTKVESNTNLEEELKELEEKKIQELIKGSEEERLLFIDHKRSLWVLALLIAFSVVILDSVLLYYYSYTCLTMVFLSLFKLYIQPVATDLSNYYEISQKTQALLPSITSFICCCLVYFLMFVFLLSKVSFESKWKRTRRENHRATLARLESIQLNQNCTN